MEIMSEGYEAYIENLRFKGLCLDKFTDEELMEGYIRYLDNIGTDEVIVEYEAEDIVFDQMKDDVVNCMGQIKLLQQRMDRLEDSVHLLVKRGN